MKQLSVMQRLIPIRCYDEMEQKPLIFIVDDDPMLSAALELMLEQEGMETQVFSNADAFLETFALSAQDYDQSPLQGRNCCAIVDVFMPGKDGLQLQEILYHQGILVPLIFLTGQGDIPTSVSAMKAGAEDFLTKPVSRAKLMASVNAAIKKSIARHNQNKQLEAGRKRLSALTPRELEVMAMTVEGLPNKVIARRLDISLRTVEHHKTNILTKTGVSSSIELSRLALESGMAFV